MNKINNIRAAISQIEKGRNPVTAERMFRYLFEIFRYQGKKRSG
jgi:hypothetical protein